MSSNNSLAMAEITEAEALIPAVVIDIPAADAQPSTTPSRFTTCRNNAPESHALAVEDPVTPRPSSRHWLRMPSLRLMVEILAVFFLSVGAAYTTTIPKLKSIIVLTFSLWKWDVLLLVLIIARRISSFVIRALMLLLTTFLRSWIRLVYVLQGARGDAQFWATWLLIYVPFYALFSEQATKKQSKLDKFVLDVATTLMVFFTISFLRCLFVWSFAAWFHVRTYNEWVKESLFHWYVVEALSGVPWINMRHHFDPKKTSAWDLKKVIINGKIGLCMNIKTEAEAKVKATRIFQRVAMPGSQFVDLEDITRFLPRDDALKFVILFPGSSSEHETAQISASLLEEWMVHAFKHERSLVRSLKTMDAVAIKANKAVQVISWIIMAIFSLPMVGIVGTWFLKFLTPAFFVVTFLSANLWKPITDSLLFVFIEHPFEIGDQIKIEDDEVEYVVEDIQVLSSGLVGSDDHRIRITNVELWSRTIKNYTRFPKTREETPRVIPALAAVAAEAAAAAATAAAVAATAAAAAASAAAATATSSNN